jgi:molecular chaperone GrpE
MTDTPKSDDLNEPEETSTSSTESDPIVEAQAEIARLRDSWLRAAADLENFRKRSGKELEDARKSARDGLLKTLLPVFDNLERALQSAQRSTDVGAVNAGLAMVQRQFIEVLSTEGIARVATVGEPFDPNVHEAIQQVESSDHAPGTVLAEVQPGYVHGERLVRPASVVVAKAKSNGSATHSG